MKKGKNPVKEIDFKAYARLRKEIGEKTEHIFNITIVPSYSEESFIDRWEVDGNVVRVVWSDTTWYEKSVTEFPLEWYSMPDDEIVAAWESDRADGLV